MDAETVIEKVGEVDLTGEVPLQFYGDQEIFEQEIENVFADTWVLIGHETEIPEPGDYSKRYIADTPLVFVRDEDGDVRVFFDMCRHRGSTVVRAEEGNTSHFRCPYHNWTYKTNGDLVGVPMKDKVYKQMEREDMGLLQVPNVDKYQGLVFASLSDDAQPLDEYLGGFKWYLDVNLNFSEEGMEVIGSPIRWEIDNNWKIGAENFSGDTYHTLSTHKSVIDTGVSPRDLTVLEEKRQEIHVADCDGHAASIGWVPGETITGYPEEVYSSSELSTDQMELAKGTITTVGTLFPNLSMIHRSFTPDPENRELTRFLSIRKWQPISVDKTQIWNWILAPKETPQEYKEAAYETAQATFSISGTFEQDDYAVWNGISEAANSAFTRKESPNVNFQMGIDEMGDANDISNEWPGPGTIYDTNLEDSVMHTFHNSWHNAMNGNPISN